MHDRVEIPLMTGRVRERERENSRLFCLSLQQFVGRIKKKKNTASSVVTLHDDIKGNLFFSSIACEREEEEEEKEHLTASTSRGKMSSFDGERRRKLNEEFDNVFREHDRLQTDLNADQIEQYQALIQSIDQWEQDAIRKIEKTARNARHDAQQLMKDATQQLQYVLNATVTESLREVLEKKENFTDFHIDRWLASLSDLRRQLETLSSVVEFSEGKAIKLIKVKQKFPLKTYDRLQLDYHAFNFEKIRGHPIFYRTEHIITCSRPMTILSQKNYAKGTHYFRFRVEQPTDELFLGIISEHDRQKLLQNSPQIPSVHGWWNIDRRVLAGRKEPYVSALNIYSGDEIIFMLNCDAKQIFLEYPSMTKLNSIQLSNDVRECPSPWRLMIETGKPGRCSLKLLDWRVGAHGVNYSERRSN